MKLNMSAMKFNAAICLTLALPLTWLTTWTAAQQDNTPPRPSQDALPATPPEQDDRVANELGNADQNPASSDPSARILQTLQAMVPFEISESGMEPEMTAAIRKFVTGQEEDARKMLEQLREKQPDLPPSDLIFGGILFATGDTAQGRRWLERCVNTDPKYPTAWTGFARIALSERRFADAEALLEKADRVTAAGDWNEKQQKLFRGEFLDGMVDVSVARGKLEDARAYLIELRELVPDNSKIPLRLGQVEFDLENVDSSLKYLREARQQSPELRVPEVIIAEWFLRKQKPDESRKWIDRAAAENPDDVSVQVDLARWLLQNEEYPEAMVAVEEAAGKGADPNLVRFIKGQVAFSRRDYDLAQMHFGELLKSAPADADANNMMALSLIENEDATKHDRALEMALLNQRMYPRSPTAAATVGWIYYRMGRMAEAENVFRQIASAKSMEPATAFFVASFLANRGETGSARTLLERAINSQSYFMYRNAARELLSRINQPSSPQGPADPPATSDPPDG